MRFISGVVSVAILFVLIAAVFIYGGWYNVAAVNPEHPVLAWTMHTTMQNSVHRHASTIVPPNDFAMRARNGFKDFDEMCFQCHGAPGMERGEIGKGLRPQPPSLSEAVRQWTPSEVFWIVKNGVHMTGMPAFGPTHDDQRIWDIVAFVRTLKNMTAEHYEQMRASETGGKHEHHDHSEHTHDQ